MENYFEFGVDPLQKKCLLEGLDDIAFDTQRIKKILISELTKYEAMAYNLKKSF